MKNKAFTLVEMIAVVIILALLLLIAVPAIGAILSNFRNVYYKNLEKELETASINYINTHRSKRPKENDKRVLCINELEKEKMIDKVLGRIDCKIYLAVFLYFFVCLWVLFHDCVRRVVLVIGSGVPYFVT